MIGVESTAIWDIGLGTALAVVLRYACPATYEFSAGSGWPAPSVAESGVREVGSGVGAGFEHPAAGRVRDRTDAGGVGSLGVPCGWRAWMHVNASHLCPEVCSLW